MTSKPLHSLRLEDDDIDFLVELEERFCIQITDEETQKLYTVGQLFDLITNKLKGVGGSKCSSMITFHKLRNALQKHVGKVILRPSTLIDSLSEYTPKQLHEKIQTSCDLRVPTPYFSRAAYIGVLICIASTCSAFPIIFLSNSFWPLLGITLVTFIGGALLAHSNKGVWGEDQETLGDIARKMTLLNYGALVMQSAKSDEESIWKTIINTIDDIIDLRENVIIDHSTRLL